MRFVEFKNILRKQLMEDARIQHAEDFLFLMTVVQVLSEF